MSLLDDLDGTIEEENKISTKIDAALEGHINNLIEVYSKSKNKINSLSHGYKLFLKNLNGFQISDVDANEFLNKIKTHEDNTFVGVFISALIQKAYDSGGNDFFINANFQKERIDYLAVYLKGSKDDPLKVTIKGDYCGRSYGWSAEHTKITFNGNIGTNSAMLASYSTFIYNAKFDPIAGYNTVHCKFYSPDKTALMKLSKIPPKRTNRFYLLDKKGNATEVNLK